MNTINFKEIISKFKIIGNSLNDECVSILLKFEDREITFNFEKLDSILSLRDLIEIINQEEFFYERFREENTRNIIIFINQIIKSEAEIKNIEEDDYIFVEAFTEVRYHILKLIYKFTKKYALKNFKMTKEQIAIDVFSKDCKKIVEQTVKQLESLDMLIMRYTSYEEDIIYETILKRLKNDLFVVLKNFILNNSKTILFKNFEYTVFMKMNLKHDAIFNRVCKDLFLKFYEENLIEINLKKGI